MFGGTDRAVIFDDVRQGQEVDILEHSMSSISIVEGEGVPDTLFKGLVAASALLHNERLFLPRTYKCSQDAP